MVCIKRKGEHCAFSPPSPKMEPARRLYVHRLSPTSGRGTTALNCPLKRGNSRFGLVERSALSGNRVAKPAMRNRPAVAGPAPGRYGVPSLPPIGFNHPFQLFDLSPHVSLARLRFLQVFAKPARVSCAGPLGADVLLPGGAAPKIGEKFVQRDLAGVIRRMVNAERKARSRGRLAGLQAARDAFYVGPIARKIASFFRERGGFLAADDLARFLPKVEAPVSVRYKDFTLYMCPPWSQGPILLQALKLLERGSPLTSSSSLNV